MQMSKASLCQGLESYGSTKVQSQISVDLHILINYHVTGDSRKEDLFLLCIYLQSQNGLH